MQDILESKSKEIQAVLKRNPDVQNRAYYENMKGNIRNEKERSIREKEIRELIGKFII